MCMVQYSLKQIILIRAPLKAQINTFLTQNIMTFSKVERPAEHTKHKTANGLIAQVSYPSFINFAIDVILFQSI